MSENDYNGFFDVSPQQRRRREIDEIYKDKFWPAKEVTNPCAEVKLPDSFTSNCITSSTISNNTSNSNAFNSTSIQFCKPHFNVFNDSHSIFLVLIERSALKEG